MTTLQALEALTEYRNDNLFSKVLTDNGLVGTETYAPSYKQAIDLCYAGILLYLAGHPIVKQGNTTIQYVPSILLAERKRIYDKWGLSMPELSNNSNSPVVRGKTVDDNYFW